MSKGSLYYLIEEDGRSRKVVNGVVTSVTQKTPLPYSPIGWTDILIVWERNITRWAQVRNYTLPMGFVRDGAMILRNDMYMGNIDRKLFLLIQKFISRIDANFFYDRYEFLYKGELDFSTFEDVPSEMRVSMSIMEGGNSKLVKANEATQFLIPFDEDAINISMDGIKITGVYQYVLPERTSGGTGFAKGMVLVGEEQKAPGVAVFSIYDGQPSSIGNANMNAGNTNYFMQIDIVPEDGIINVSGTIRMSVPDGGFPANIVLQVFNLESGTQRPDISLFTGPEASEIIINKDITVLRGDRLFLEIDEYTFESNLTFTLKTRYDTTIIKGFRPVVVYRKLCLKLGIPVSAMVSNILEASTIMLTSGDGIRGIQASDVGIRTNINEFFKAFDVYRMLGFDIKSTVRIETRETFFRTNDPVVLGEVSDFKTVPADDLMYSSIKVGHKEQDIEDVNGKYDFNGTMVFTTPVLKGGGKQMDLVSPYKAGPYEIETIRANLDGKNTTDNDRDNEVYAIVCAPSSDVINTTVTFIASGNIMVFPNGVNILKGQKISVAGSAAGNDREYNILDVGSGIVQIAELDVTPTNESGVPVTITILSGQVYSLDRSITVTSGVPDPATIFNVAISPKRLLMAHYRWIRSFLYNYEPGQLIFQQANRNSDLVAGGVIEKANVDISSMGERLFLPYYHEFKTKVPVDYVEIQDSDPDAPLLPTWLGNDYLGFVWKSGISPNSNTPQVFKILSGPDNDITRLIA